jgi:hypothetical protein
VVKRYKSMNIVVSLETVENRFGPPSPGKDRPGNTISLIRAPAGRRETYTGPAVYHSYTGKFIASAAGTHGRGGNA